MKRVLAMLLVLAMGLSLAGCGATSGQQSALEDFIGLAMECDEDAVEDCAPAIFWEYIDSEFHVKIEDIAHALSKKTDSSLDSMEKLLGDDISFEVEVKDADELDRTDKNDYIEGLEKYDIEEENVDDVLKVEYYIVFSGDDDDQYGANSAIMAKIDGDWYLIEALEELAELAAELEDK